VTASAGARYGWRARIGFITPTPGSENNPFEFYLMAPEGVTIVLTSLGVMALNQSEYDAAVARLKSAVDEMVKRRVDAIIQAGVPLSAQLDRPRVRELLSETQQRTGLVADAAIEVIIDALQHLGASRVAIASRFADQVNQRLVAYLADAGIAVPAITRRDHWARDIAGESIEAGITLAVDLGREAMRQAPDAEALLLPGGSWRALAVVPLLEEDFGRPVITNATARAWRLMHEGLAPPKPGWGALLASP